MDSAGIGVSIITGHFIGQPQAKGKNSELWTLSPTFHPLLLTSLVSYMKYNKIFIKTMEQA